MLSGAVGKDGAISNADGAKDFKLMRRGFKFSVHECSARARKELRGLFPGRDMAGEPLYAIALSHKTENDMEHWSEDIEDERCMIFNEFILTAVEVVKELQGLGWWADFIDPYSGKPYLSPHTNETLLDTDERMTYFGFRLEELSCCKCLVHPEYGSRAVVGILFTTATLTDDLLHHLTSPGQESAGIVVTDGASNYFRSVKEIGLVNRVFSEAKLQSLSNGIASLGHVRYSTNGVKDCLSSVQPFIVYTQRGIMAIAHNGELSNVTKVRRQLLKKGVGLSTDTDSELIAQLIASHEDYDCMMAIRDIMWTLSASYSLVIMLADRLLAVRDPWGNRPLCIGSLAGDSEGSETSETLAWFVSSESCAFASLSNARLLREVEPGEIVELAASGITRSVCVSQPSGGTSAFCIFEYIYFARADSIFEGQQVYRARFRCGVKLAKEAPVDADLISTVPSSATPAALGFSQSSGIPYQEVFCKSNYVGRSFIQPFDNNRKSSIKQKFAPLIQNYSGRRVVLVDDSIVRGNTMAVLVKLLKDTGASEVHIRIASPPIRHPCYFGINIPTREELLAHQKSLADIKTFLGADSVAYLSIEGLVEVISSGANSKIGAGYCTACLTGVYPVNIDW